MAGTDGSTIIQSVQALNPKLAAVPENSRLIYSQVYTEFAPVKDASSSLQRLATQSKAASWIREEENGCLLHTFSCSFNSCTLKARGNFIASHSIQIELFPPFLELYVLRLNMKTASIQMTGNVLRSLNSNQTSIMKISRNGGIACNIKWSYKPYKNLASKIRDQLSTTSIILVSSSTPKGLQFLSSSSAW